MNKWILAQKASIGEKIMQNLFMLIAFSLGSFFLSNVSNAQEVHTVPMKESRWDIEANSHSFEKINGFDALILDNGKARIKEVDFQTGIIDFDMFITAGRKFLGVHFHIEDGENYEEFYIRPHQSGNPDANQYTPVFNGLAGWQLYHGEGYGKPHTYTFDTWTHFRLVIAEDRMEVFIDDMTRPLLYTPNLLSEIKNGTIGFGTFLGTGIYANLNYQKLDNPQLMSEAKEPPVMAAEVVRKWELSPTITSISLDNTLESSFINSFDWKKVDTEYTGTINLAKHVYRTDSLNVVLARINIYSDYDQIKQLAFGYSDKASVYVNRQLVYAGDNSLRSRDYRYLGTIGYFDAIYLNLKTGKNEVVFAIAEQMGGWGLKAKFENLDGIKLQ